MRKLVVSFISLVCFLFIFTACGNNSFDNKEEKRADENEVAENAIGNTVDNKDNQVTVAADYLAIAEKATLQYESKTDSWRYAVYKDNTGHYNCYVVLYDYLSEIPIQLELPAEIDSYPVIAVMGYDEDFINSSVFDKLTDDPNHITKSLIMPNSIIYIGKGAFCYCDALSDIKWSQNITRIGECAFRGCYELKIWNPPAKLNCISWGAFSGCGFTEIIIPDTVTFIGESAFSNSTYLEKVTIPTTVTHIGEGAFDYIVTIYGYAGSEAARYAADENKNFKVIN